LGPSGTDLELVIKNPARSAEEDFSLRASGDWTVQQLKKQIERAYHGNPNPELQTLIYCGKVLKDPTTKLSSVLGLGQEPDGEERQSTRTLHMVVKQLQPPPSGRSSNRPTGERSVPASASQTPSPADRGAGAIPAPSAQPPPLPVHEHGPPPPPPVGDPPGAAEPAAGGVSPSACAGLEAVGSRSRPRPPLLQYDRLPLLSSADPREGSGFGASRCLCKSQQLSVDLGTMEASMGLERAGRGDACGRSLNESASA